MGIIERIKLFREYLGLGQTAFEVNVGVAKGYFSNVKTLGSDKIMRIHEKYPTLNIEWLITGDGNMLKDNEYIQRLDHPKATEKSLTDQEVNLYDIYAAANLKTLFLNKNQNILGKISVPDMPKCDGAVYVTGDSMYPLLKSGDIVVYKEVRDFQNVIYGEMYLVSFELDDDDYLAVKYVNRSEEDGKIKLVSYNTHHEPKDIPVDSIRAMALVKLSIRKNTMI